MQYFRSLYIAPLPELHKRCAVGRLDSIVKSQKFGPSFIERYEVNMPLLSSSEKQRFFRHALPFCRLRPILYMVHGELLNQWMSGSLGQQKTIKMTAHAG
jgi:hypothetical protein